MVEKTLQPKTSPPSETQPPREAWRPRERSDLGFNTNPFEDFDYRGGSSDLSDASLNRPVVIRDATEDTSPLQGSKDVSDDDYLDDGL